MKAIRLCDICDFQGGAQPPKNQWIDERREGYVRMLQIRDFTQIEKVKPEFVQISARVKMCKEDDILIARYGASVGKILTGLSGAYNVAIMKTIPDEKKISKKYLFYFLSSEYFQKFIMNVGSRAAQAGFNKDDLQNVMLIERTLEEQQVICKVLDKITELITNRKTELRLLDKCVKSRFVELFRDYRPEIKLSNVADITGGLTKNSKRDKMDIKLPYLRVANVLYNNIDVSDVLEIGLTEVEKTKTLLKYGDLLFVEGNGSPDQIGRVAVWRDEIVPCVHQNHLIKARFKEHTILPMFAMYYYMTQDGREQIKKKAVSTSGLYTLSISKVENFLIPYPPLDLQKQFIAFVEQVDKSKLAVQKSLDELETLKKSLMQQYFG